MYHRVFLYNFMSHRVCVPLRVPNMFCILFLHIMGTHWRFVLSLSDTKLRGILNKKYSERYELSDRDGLSIRVSEIGSITFQYRYRFKKKPKRLALGRYPGVSLAEARAKVPSLRQALEEGRDPARLIEEKKNKQKVLIDECIDLFLERHVSTLREGTEYLYKYTLNKHARGVLKEPVEDMTIQDWYAYFDSISAKYTPITARDMLRRLKACIRFAIKRGLILHCQIIHIYPRDVGANSVTGERVPSIDELKVIWNEIDKSRCYPTTGNVIKLCMLTGARMSEVRLMEKKDLDLEKKIWTVPKEKSKTKRKIVRPLSDDSYKIIKWQLDTFSDFKQVVSEGGKEVFTQFVFPSGSYKKNISSQTVNKLCRLIRDRKSMEEWIAHDFRRSLTTILTSHDVALHVSEKMLGHSLGGVLEIYNKNEWLPEQQEAYDKWANLILK